MPSARHTSHSQRLMRLVLALSLSLCLCACDGATAVNSEGDDDTSATDTTSAETDVGANRDTSSPPADTTASEDTTVPTDTPTDTAATDTAVTTDTASDQDTAPPADWDRVTDGIVVLYTFDEGAGTIIHDVGGRVPPLDLNAINIGTSTWIEGGAALSGGALLSTTGAASRAADAWRASNALTVEAWLSPSNASQTGPARIFGVSGGPATRDVMLGQQAGAYVARLRTTQTDDNGLPEFTTPQGHAEPGLTHVVYTRDPGGAARIYVDGVEVASTTVGGDLSNLADYPIHVGNEADGARPWSGTLFLIAAYDRAITAAEVSQNFAAGPEGIYDVNPDPPDPDPTCIGETLDTSWDVTEADHVKNYPLPLELGVAYDTLEITFEFDPAVWGELCWNPAWTPARLFEPFHYLVQVTRGAHWCKGGNLFELTLRDGGSDKMIAKTYHKPAVHTGSGCGTATDHEIFNRTFPVTSGTLHTARVYYDVGAGTMTTTIDGQSVTGPILPQATIEQYQAQHPLQLTFSFVDWLECYDAAGNHDATFPCCHIPSPGWRYRNIAWEACR